MLAAFYVPSALGQATSNPSVQASMPSDTEVQDLLKKADEKVAVFEQAVNAAKIHLDKINPKLSANYLDAASAAHDIISKTQKNGASSYRLVALLATLDDLSLDASNAAFQLLRADTEQSAKGHSSDLSRYTSILPLESAQVGCNDIAELLMHTTLRGILAEEMVLEAVTAQKK
jgi:hypothetical protein